MCKIKFNNAESNTQKNFDHCHVTRKYRGAACGLCNRKMRLSRNTLVIYFHNFRGYDNHHILFGFSNRLGWNIEPIPQNYEKFICLTAKFHVDTIKDKLYHVLKILMMMNMKEPNWHGKNLNVIILAII